MKVLLISCYELGHQPIGLASPAAHIRAAGLPVKCLDLAVEPFDKEKVQHADFIGISIPMHTAIRLAVRAGKRVRELNKTCHLCFYGLYASLNAEYLLRTCADSIIGGEFETPLVRLLQHLTGESDGQVLGVRTKSRLSEPFLGRQQFLPPSRDLLPPLEQYAHLDSGNGSLKVAGYTEASRGCAHLCRHCPIPPVFEGRLRIVQEDVVIKDIDNLVAMGALHITFGDPDFLNGAKHSMSIVRRMHERCPHLTFDVTAKIEHILELREMIEELGRLGCLFIVSAVESLNDDILMYLDKGHTAADVLEALEITRSANVSLRPSLVSFTPWTTLDDFLEVLQFVERHDLIYNIDPVQYSIRLLLPPGSWLLNIPEIKPFLGKLEEENFAYQWTNPDTRLDQLHQEVSKVVEEAVRSNEDSAMTFYKIKDLTLETLAGRRVSWENLKVLRKSERPPRLTEPWFCCAEPTENQFVHVNDTPAGI